MLPIDTNCPAVIETAPSDKAEGVLVNAEVFVYFDEAIMPGENHGEIALYDITTGEAGEALGAYIQIHGRTLALALDEVLKYSSVYRVEVPAGAIKDLNENTITSDVIFEFHTANAPDIESPVLISTTPLAGAITNNLRFFLA